MHINSTLSRPNRKYCSFDVKNFYLNTPMERYEYMKIPITQIPEEIINEYKLRNKVHTDWAVYIEIRKGMYGLPQAGMLANKLLKRRLAQHGYYEVRHTPGYWRHMWRPIDFTLVVDDFGVGYEKMSTPCTCSKRYDSIMKLSPWIGPEPYIVASASNGTMSNGHASSACPAMSNRPSANFTMAIKALLSPLTPLIHTKQAKNTAYP